MTAGDEPIIDKGFLVALRDPAVVEMAKRYGDPVELLESWPLIQFRTKYEISLP